MTQRAQHIVVDRPVEEVYDDWSDGQVLARMFDDEIDVEPVARSTTRWTLPLGVSRRRIVVREIRTSTRRDIVWLSVSGPRLAGRVSFRPLGSRSTCVRLSVDFDPRNPLGWLAERAGVPDRVLESVLRRFKESAEQDGPARDHVAPEPDYELRDHPRSEPDMDLRGPTVESSSRRTG